MLVIDCVKSPPVDAMRAAGVVGVSRYLYWADSRDTLGKVIHQPEYDWLTANRFGVLLNWEGSATDWLGGAAAAQIHATEAVRQAKALGYPAGCAIPGSADFNMTAAQWSTSGASYARTYSQIVRAAGYVAGVYGPYDVLTWCQQLGGFGMFWQSMSTSWSAGRNAKLWPGAHLRQRGSMSIGGQDCDYNDIIQANYGGTMSAHTDMLIEAANAGMTSNADGSPCYFTVRRISDEKWMANVTAALAADQTRDAALLAAIQAIIGGGSSIDTRVVVDAINAAAAAESAAVQQLHAELADTRARLAAALAAAGQALNG